MVTSNMLSDWSQPEHQAAHKLSHMRLMTVRATSWSQAESHALRLLQSEQQAAQPALRLISVRATSWSQAEKNALRLITIRATSWWQTEQNDPIVRAINLLKADQQTLRLITVRTPSWAQVGHKLINMLSAWSQWEQQAKWLVTTEQFALR